MYVIGTLSKEEREIIESRGWEIEKAPDALTPEPTEPGDPPREPLDMVWVDQDLFVVMNGQGWDGAPEPKPEVEPPAPTIQQAAQAALDVQNASNVSGVVHSWSRYCPAIRQHAKDTGVDFNSHPVNVLFADKLASLTRSQVASFAGAIIACEKIAKGG